MNIAKTMCGTDSENVNVNDVLYEQKEEKLIKFKIFISKMENKND
jgi:hypothetical protein